MEDVTEDAIKALRMIEAFDRKKDRITIVNAVSCFRGHKGSGDKGLDGNPHFGVGKDWDKGEAERLLQTLLLENALEEEYITNKSGWSNAYLKVCLPDSQVGWM